MKHQTIDVDGTRGVDYAGERNDCTVFAIATASGMPYGAAHRELEVFGRRRGKGVSTLSFFEFKGWRIANYEVVDVPMFAYKPTWASVRYLTVKGRYLIRVKAHVFAVVNGVIYDTSANSGNLRVRSIHKLEAR